MLNSISNAGEKVIEVWAVNSFTLRRDIFTDNTERSIEAAAFCVFRLELINANKLKISVSKPDTIQIANRRTAEIVTTKMLNGWKKKKVFISTLILNKTL